jgi:protein tyrosine/serine phosphatase
MTAWEPDDDKVERFLRIVTDPSRTPVFVHCQHGADRTGMMVAMYRVVVQGWSKADAIDEMRRGGFGFHPIWRVLPQYVRDVKVDVLRVSLGPQLLARDEQQ